VESEKIRLNSGDDVLVRGDEVLSKDHLDPMEINDKGSTELMGAELLIVGAALDGNNTMDCTMKSVESGGDSGISGGAGILNFEKDCGPISVHGIWMV
jgi:hypothetical protein